MTFICLIAPFFFLRYIIVTSAFRKDDGGVISGAIVEPSKRSNHFIGHAIDMNVIDGKKIL